MAGDTLAQDPKLLLVDEPAAGMTAPEREVTVTLLRDLARTRSVVVVEHDMEFIRALDCRVTVMHEGSVLAEGSMEFVTGNQKVIDVYLGVAMLNATDLTLHYGSSQILHGVSVTAAIGEVTPWVQTVSARHHCSGFCPGHMPAAGEYWLDGADDEVAS